MSLVVENTPPGVTAIINASEVSRPFVRQPTSTAFAVGFAPWGPVGVPKLVTSWQEFKRIFGGFHPLGWIADLAYVFFNYFGGKQMYLVRAAGESAAAATITVDNRVTPTPDATFKFDALYPSSTVDIQVIIADGATTAVVDITVKSVALNITEKYTGVDLRTADDLAALNAHSKLVVASLVDDAVSGATGRPAAGTFTLAGGDDDTDGYDMTDLGDYLASFEDEAMGNGQVLIPGYGADNQAALVAHAELMNRLALVEDALAKEYTDVDDDLNASKSTYEAVYYPWVEMNTIDGTSGKKFYPPTIYAAGACALVDRTRGTHKAPANVSVPGAVDVERNDDGSSVINDNVRGYLNQRNINVIGPIAGEGIKVYGARVYAPAGETRVQFVHERRMLNLIYYTAKQGYAWAVFEVVDRAGGFFRNLKTSGQNFLRNLWKSGALYGETEQQAFTVVADSTNNPEDELAVGRVHVQLGVKLSPTAEQVFVNIDNVPLGQDLSVFNGGAN